MRMEYSRLREEDEMRQPTAKFELPSNMHVHFLAEFEVYV